MYIKQFRSVEVRVSDPLHPGKRAIEERLIPTGGVQLSHAGRVFDADDDGWFDVDHDTARELIAFRHPNGERFYLPEQVDEQISLGAAAEDEGMRRIRPGKRGRVAVA